MLTRYNRLMKLRPAEVIVVVLVCLFLLAVMPLACRKVRPEASRATCAQNLSGIGKATLIYANDYDGNLPRSGGSSSYYGETANWRGADRSEAYNLKPDGSGGTASISSCFYLLVKYAAVAPRYFVCPGDSGTKEFRLVDADAGKRKLVDLRDFGPVAFDNCSYAYHMPFSPYPLTTSCDPGMAVAADRNPWISSRAAEAKRFPGKFSPVGDAEAIKAGNSISHQEEGQNVLFLDRHVNFEDRSCCGVNDDNIYTSWDGGDIRIGQHGPGPGQPASRTDSLLIHDLPQVAPITIEQLKASRKPRTAN